MARFYLKVSASLVFVSLILNLTGCLGSRVWEYPPAPPGNFLGLTSSSPINLRVVVLPLEDLRGKEVQEEYWKLAVPLIPYATTSYDRVEEVVEPEPVDLVRFDPPQDFSQALADEIREAGVFSSVTYAGKGTIPQGDLILSGKLRSTRWERNITTYLLGPLGTVFWIIGLPMGNTVTTMDMDLQLAPAGNPSQVLWGFTMEFEGKEYDSPYYGLEAAVQSYPSALQETLRPAVTNLVEISEKRPNALQPGG